MVSGSPVPVDEGPTDATFGVQRVISAAKRIGNTFRQRTPISLAGEIDVVQGPVKIGIPHRAADDINIWLTG